MSDHIRTRAASSGASSAASSSVHFSDQRLASMAADAAAALRWDALAQQLRRPSSHWRRRRAAVSSTVVYTREDQLSFSVLASALLPCSVQELRLVFDAHTSEQFADVMRALSPRDLRSAELVHVVDAASSRASQATSVQSTQSSSSSSGTTEALVAVTALTLASPRVFARSERWCFLEHLVDNDNNSSRGFTKTLLALSPADCLACPETRHRSVRDGHDVLAGLRFEEAVAGCSTRVLFTAELFYNNADASSHSASHRLVRARLLQMADWVDNVAVVVRRRRLGIQVLADRRVIRAGNTHCVCCRRSFQLLARKKSCALCGFTVCERCSVTTQRETCAATFARSELTLVRVCELCTMRVDQCRYTMVGPRDLTPARVRADDDNSTVVGRQSSTATTGVVLTQLLQETMACASDARKKSVLSLIKYLVDQENRESDGSHAVTLTAASSEAQHFAALEAQLTDKPLPLDQCVLASAGTRAYPLAYPAELERPVLFPVPASEQQRLQLLRDEPYSSCFTSGTLLATLALVDDVPELDIICALAVKEMACSGSLITLVDEQTMHVVSSTLAVFAHKTFPREQGFCAQTIMSDQPLLVLRPEADVRFATIAPVANFGVRFYCGFPLFAPDGTTVVGSMCCVAHEPRTLSQSQYTVMKKLAQTASRVVQLQARTHRDQQQRRRLLEAKKRQLEREEMPHDAHHAGVRTSELTVLV